MKKIILERLTFRNFKGFREFVLDTKGGDIDVFGDNGTGKTTLFDGFIWLLFGKDSSNKADFKIKGLDAAGKVRQHKLEHEVEGDFLINDRRKSFRRVYTEKWTKKRGSATEAFDGHETSYYIDGVPYNAGEYKAEVDSIIKEDLFKLLTSPTFFNEQLKKEERRKVLLEICGDITDAEVIHSNKALERLPSILADRDVESHRKVVAAQCKTINDEIKELPIRISEAQRSQPNIVDLDEELLQEDIDNIRSRMKMKESELSRIRNGGEVASKEKRLNEIEGILITIKNRLQSTVLDRIAIKRSDVDKMQSELDSVRRQINDKQEVIKKNEKNSAECKQKATRLRTEWTQVNTRVFTGQDHDKNCPTCLQALPSDQIEAAHQKAEAEFNKLKSTELEEISAKGKAATEEEQGFERANNGLQDEINTLNNKLTIIQADLAKVETELTKLRAEVQAPEADLEYKKLLKESETVKREIKELGTSTEPLILKAQNEIDGLQTDLQSIEEDKAKFAQVRKTEERIAVLEQQEKELAVEYERLQEELFLTEEFTRTKISLLDSKINSKFKYARFKLFDDQLNGGLKELCDTTFNGVPYGGGLNNAAEYNVGLDIINTLSQYYDISVPIFFDNAESVTKLIDTDAQVIRLVVSEKDKKLRIVTKSSDIQEAI